MKNLNFTAIDFETATCERSSICEIGITVVNNSEISSSKSWLVKPPNNEYDGFNSYIHGITPAMTKHSLSFPTVWKEVLPYLEGNVVVAHNTGFDMYALRDALLENNIPFPKFDYFCSYRLARYTIDNCYSYSLPTICETLGVNLDSHHRAEADSKACAEVFIKCIQKSSIDSFAELETKYHFKKGEFDIDLFKPQRSVASSGSSIKVKDIIGDPSKIEEDSIFYEKVVCFTGTCKYGVRKELLQRIADIGGKPVDSVTKNTNILIVGQQDYRVVGASGMSSKQRKAMELKKQGHNIEIMSEEDFLSNI